MASVMTRPNPRQEKCGGFVDEWDEVFFGVLGAQQLANGEQSPSAHQTEPLLSCGGTLQVEDVLLLRTAAKGRVEGPL